MNTKTILAVAAVLVLLGSGYAVARPADGFWNGMMGYGNGMMGRSMMYGSWNGFGSMMGYGSGMMGGYGYCLGDQGNRDVENGAPLTIENAKESVEQYLASAGNPDLELTEVMEFTNHFYAEVKEKSTGVHAFELLVDRYTGAVYPETGPNLMWNTKYGHMTWGNTQATVTKEQALKNAEEYLDRALPGTKADEADAFYGYYTIHVLKDGKIYGMLSVNSNTGAVWYHHWHGTFVKILEVE